MKQLTSTATAIVAKCKPELITTENQNDILEELSKEQGPFGLDTETVGIDPRKVAPARARDAKIVCWSLACRDRWGRYRRWFGWADCLAAFGDWLRDAPLVGHNIWGFDYHMLANHGIYLGNVVCDTLHYHRLLTNGRSKQHGLKHLLKSILGIEQPSYKDLFSRRKNLGEKSYKRVGVALRDSVRVCTGGKYSSVGATELIELDRIATDYPQRVAALHDYATLDALGTLMLYERFVD